MMLQQAEVHQVPLEEITLAQDQQEAVLLQHVILRQLEEALTLQERDEQLLEAILPDLVLPQPEEAVIHQILGTIILQQEDPLPLIGIIAAALLEAHHQEALALETLALEVLVRAKVHLHLKKGEIRKYCS
jgi:hypothetical protein